MSEEKVEKITPYDGSEAKTGQVRRMFDSIAPAYDTMNRLMTFGIDRRWRRKTVAEAVSGNPEAILDIATGTGDLAIALARAAEGATVTGVDLSEGMIEVGRRKVAEAGLSDRVSLSPADALALPFADNSFDVITVAFGVRNFEHLAEGYAEMLRVLRPGGKLCVLELTPPSSVLAKPFYSAYTRGVIPLVGKLISGDSDAYTYLPRSIAAVPARKAMTSLIAEAGFVDAAFRSFTFGVCTLYTARKGK
ncbi:MAG: bifunctional demethylmenaquinone methyltransferase/2-methoxy-6-polyprenyl-1,4-benzoquinol methylase UbiE [Muribaculaceae bacterium]